MTYRKIFNFLMLFATFSLCSGHSAVMFAEQDNSDLPVVQEFTPQTNESDDKPSDEPMLDESANPVQQRDPLIAELSEKNIPAVIVQKHVNTKQNGILIRYYSMMDGKVC